MAAQPFKHAQALFVGSVMFAIMAVGFISLLSNSSSQSSSDVRAKAGITATLKLTGIVSSVDSVRGVLTINNLQFLDQTSANLGTWTVTPPTGFNVFSVSPGTKITLIVNPTTFTASTHTLTATQITVSR